MRFFTPSFSSFLPQLIDIQQKSFSKFINQGIIKELSKRTPITNPTSHLKLIFYPKLFHLSPPQCTIKEALRRGKSYSCKLYVPSQLVNLNKKEIYFKWIMFGDLPLMTERGHFILNGSPRVIINQLVRSPGIYYQQRIASDGEKTFYADLIPQRGAWLRLEVDKKGNLWARMKRASKIPLLTFLQAFGLEYDKIYNTIPFQEVNLSKNTPLFLSPEKALEELSLASSVIDQAQYSSRKDKEKEGNAEVGYQFLFRKFLNPRTYDLGEIGRDRLNQKLRLPFSKTKTTITAQDILFATDHLLKCRYGAGSLDDIDHLKNRRIRASGELLQNQFDTGLIRLEKTVREKMGRTATLSSLLSSNRYTVLLAIQGLVTTKPLNGALREFFGSSPLSQYMDQTNPLAEITHKRRITSVGPGGVSRETAGMAIRGIHSTYYGRICPIETPEGKQAGLVNSITTYAKINSQGFLETPYYKVLRGQAQKSTNVTFLSAEEEEKKEVNLAPGDFKLSPFNFLPKGVLPFRKRGQMEKGLEKDVDYVAISPVQMISVATSLIPFLEHDDANRALMGSNMQRQAVPLIRPERPLVGTGLEARVVADSGHGLQAKGPGFIEYVSGKTVILRQGCKSLKNFSFISKNNLSFHLLDSLFGANPDRLRTNDVFSETKNKSSDAARESGKMHFGNEDKQKQEKAKMVALQNKACTSNFKINQSNTLQSQLPELHNETIGFFRETYQFKNRFLGYTKCVPSFIFNFTKFELLSNVLDVFGVPVFSEEKTKEQKKNDSFFIDHFVRSKIFAEQNLISKSQLQMILSSQETYSAQATIAAGHGFSKDNISLCPKKQLFTWQNIQTDILWHKYSIEKSRFNLKNNGRFLPEIDYQLLLPFYNINPYYLHIQSKNHGATTIAGGYERFTYFFSSLNNVKSLKKNLKLVEYHIQNIVPDAARESGKIHFSKTIRARGVSGAMTQLSQLPSKLRNKKIDLLQNKSNIFDVDVFKNKEIKNKEQKQQHKNKTIKYQLQNYQRSNQATCLHQYPAVEEGNWVEKGDLVANCSASALGELALGKNILLAYMPWDGYNFEDAILISDRLVNDDIYTSIHIERYEISVKDTEYGLEQITANVPDVPDDLTHLNEDGVAKIGSWVKEGDILVGKITPIEKELISPYQKLFYSIIEKPEPTTRDTSLRVPKGIQGRVISHEIFEEEELISLENFDLTNPLQEETNFSLSSKLNQLGKYDNNFFPFRLPKGNMNACHLFDVDVLSETKNKEQTQSRELLFSDKNNRIINNPSFSTSQRKDDLINLQSKSKSDFLSEKKLNGKHGGYATIGFALPTPDRGNNYFPENRDFPLENSIRAQHTEQPLAKSEEKLKADLKNKWETFEGQQKMQSDILQSKTDALPEGGNYDSEFNRAQFAEHLRAKQKEKEQKFQRLKMEVLTKKNFLINSKTEAKDIEQGTEFFQPSSNFQSRLEKRRKIKSVHLYIVEKRRIQVGDKLAGRHGNKGIVSRILSKQDMPYLPDGTPMDMVLNPLGVPSRMNVGQVFECLLGLAAGWLGDHFKITPFDEIYGSEASRSLVYLKLYQARLKTGQKWLFNPQFPGKVRVFDGRTGDRFDQAVTIGRGYILKLVHMVDEKIHARSTGPYSLVTQQPVRGRSKGGGQRVGEMEVWALEGFGAAYALQELLTVKSDDVKGRRRVFDAILKRKRIFFKTPESFKLLVRELQCLCLDVGIYVETGAFNRTKIDVMDLP